MSAERAPLRMVGARAPRSTRATAAPAGGRDARPELGPRRRVSIRCRLALPYRDDV